MLTFHHQLNLSTRRLPTHIQLSSRTCPLGMLPYNLCVVRFYYLISRSELRYSLGKKKKKEKNNPFVMLTLLALKKGIEMLASF